MSGTASLSAAKNRRSGNEVKFNGQAKPSAIASQQQCSQKRGQQCGVQKPMPPQYGQPQHGQPQHGQPQHGQPQHGQPQHGQPQHGQPQHGTHKPMPPQYGQQIQPPHPLVLLKSHELRLQKVESIILSESDSEYEFAANSSSDKNYSSLIKDFAAHKEDFESFKRSQKLHSEKIVLDKTSLHHELALESQKKIKSQGETITRLEENILNLHNRIDDMYKIFTRMTSDSTSDKETHIQLEVTEAPEFMSL
jgi:hypothetical protein